MDKKYLIDTEQNKAFMDALGEDLLRFGQGFPHPRGGAWYLGDDGSPMQDRPIQTFITARMCHVYSVALLQGKGEGDAYGVLADKALAGLTGWLRDEKNGGWFGAVEPDGTPLPDKQCYAHAFVILAASSALLAGRQGAGALLEEALAVFDRYFWDEQAGMTRDTWSTDFAVLDDYRGLNANMHTVEAFLAAADATGEEKYRARCGRIIDRVIAFAEKNDWRIPEHYTREWVPDLECNADRPADQFKPYGATPGHGLEWARLICEWATSTYGVGQAQAQPYVDAAQALYKRAVEDGWNADGEPGIVYTTDWTGKPVVHDRMHWTLCEGINTAAVLYRLTGKEKYAADYAAFLAYADEKVVDHTLGSWFHQMDRHNQVIDTVWPGKNDLYHAYQATQIPYLPCELSIATAAKNGTAK